VKGEEMKGEKKSAALMLAHFIIISGLFIVFHLLALHKKLDKDFCVFVQQKTHAFGMALLVAASPPVRKRRG
jgi:hypothetical protein